MLVNQHLLIHSPEERVPRQVISLVLQRKQWIRINGSVELLDTPGILWPKIEDRNVGERLANDWFPN